jgi:hypothetical protein
MEKYVGDIWRAMTPGVKAAFQETVGSASPPWGMAWKTKDFALGDVPYDGFRDQDIMDKEDLYRMEGVKKLWAHAVKQGGVAGDIYEMVFGEPAAPPESSSPLFGTKEQDLRESYVAGRFIKLHDDKDNYRRWQHYADAKDLEEEKRAQMDHGCRSAVGLRENRSNLKKLKPKDLTQRDRDDLMLLDYWHKKYYEPFQKRITKAVDNTRWQDLAEYQRVLEGVSNKYALYRQHMLADRFQAAEEVRKEIGEIQRSLSLP